MWLTTSTCGETSPFNTTLEGMRYNEDRAVWTLCTSGATFEARFVVSAMGCMSVSRVPAWPGVEKFAGETFHTGRWPHDPVDLAGKRIGVIGTGSSGVQLIPQVAAVADQVVVFQRTPNFVIPAGNRPLGADEIAEFKRQYPAHRAADRVSLTGVAWKGESRAIAEIPRDRLLADLDARWSRGGTGFLAGLTDVGTDEDANGVITDFVRDKIQAIVDDPDVAALLQPFDHPIGAKRLCYGTDYYQTYNRDNVTLHNLRADPIVEFRAEGLRTAATAYELDAVVFATGYDAVTGPLMRVNPLGPGGVSLADTWRAGPRTYLGVASADFPNIFIITGPGSPSVLTNMVTAVEQHVDWVADLLDFARAHGYSRIEAGRDAQDTWVEQVDALVSKTLFLKAASWYVGANVPGKARVFMAYVGGLGRYRALCDEVAQQEYAGFDLC